MARRGRSAAREVLGAVELSFEGVATVRRGREVEQGGGSVEGGKVGGREVRGAASTGLLTQEIDGAGGDRAGETARAAGACWTGRDALHDGGRSTQVRRGGRARAGGRAF